MCVELIADTYMKSMIVYNNILAVDIDNRKERTTRSNPPLPPSIQVATHETNSTLAHKKVGLYM